jgi:hypothetical protein
MKDRDLRKFLKEADRTQVSQSRKEETVQLASRMYVNSRHPSNVTMWTLIRNNIGYISAGFWLIELLCLLLLGTFLPVVKGIENNKVGIFIVSVGTAILMIFCLPEMIRSFRYGMWELEKTCRFNLTQLTACKLTIVSGIDIVLLVVSSYLFSPILNISTLQLLVYILVPFNLLSLTILGTFHYKGHGGFIFSALIGWIGITSAIFTIDSISLIYEPNNLWFWIVMFVSTGIANFICIYKFINNIQKEAFDKWNFLLID